MKMKCLIEIDAMVAVMVLNNWTDVLHTVASEQTNVHS